MGYENTAVIGVDSTIYGEIDFGDREPDDISTHGERTFYTFEWDKYTSLVVEHFLDNIAKREEDLGYIVLEDFGIIMLGEELDDIRTEGDYWNFDMDVHRSIEIN